MGMVEQGVPSLEVSYNTQETNYTFYSICTSLRSSRLTVILTAFEVPPFDLTSCFAHFVRNVWEVAQKLVEGAVCCPQRLHYRLPVSVQCLLRRVSFLVFVP